MKHTSSPQEILRAAMRHHQDGQLEAAEQRYRQLLNRLPRHADALQLLGTLKAQQGQVAEAVDLLRRSLAVDPRVAHVHENLASVLRSAGELESAVSHYEQALRIKPAATAYAGLGYALLDLHQADLAACQFETALAMDASHARAWTGRARARVEQGRLDAAIEDFSRALALRPQDAQTLNDLGNALDAQGDCTAAEASLRRAVEIQPGFAVAWSNLGDTLRHLGRPDEAIEACRQALALAPDMAEMHSNLGNALLTRGAYEEACTCFERALALKPGTVRARVGLGTALQGLGRLQAAIAAYDEALRLEPGAPDAMNNLAQALQLEGRFAEARQVLRQLLATSPNAADAHSNLIFCMDLDPAVSPEETFAERRRWNELHAAPLEPRERGHANAVDADRCIRVGYVSSDFKFHSAAYAFGPVLFSHDPEQVEAWCFSGVSAPDAMTDRFREAVGERFITTAGMSDDAVATLVREVGIDILVDLSGHSAGNRLLVFARRPAPVQVTAWGYGMGTGLDAIDYLLVDPITVPEELASLYSEKVVWLPSCMTYMPIPGTPSVAPLPASSCGHVTFGCLNRFSKITPETLALWARILGECPRARLLLKAPELDDEQLRRDVSATFTAEGIDPARLELLGRTSQVEHQATYGRIDVGLDPYPFQGGITSIESLWMGVPFVTLRGTRQSTLLGPQFLEVIGLPDWIAGSPHEYVSLAAHHARDLEKLARLRADLRERVAGSPLGNSRLYCSHVEEAYREMWRTWCQGVKERKR